MQQANQLQGELLAQDQVLLTIAVDGNWYDFAVPHVQVITHDAPNLMFFRSCAKTIFQCLLHRPCGVNEDIVLVHLTDGITDDLLLRHLCISGVQQLFEETVVLLGLLA